MTLVTEEQRKKKYTEEEREALFDAYFDACGADKEEAYRLLPLLPVTPHWAKIIAEVMGAKYLREHFNITHADEVLGEGWLDAYAEEV